MGRSILDRNVTRRQAIKGAAALGAATAAVSVVSGCSGSSGSTSAAASPTVVDSNSARYVTGDSDGNNAFTTDGVATPLVASGEWDLPLGSVLHDAEGTWLPLLATTSSSTGMVAAQAFSLSSGNTSTVVSTPVTSSSGYVIYDVRCSDEVYAWVELDTLSREWKLLAARFSAGDLQGSTTTLWEGDSNYDPPLFCCAGSRVIWQVMPSSSGKKTSESSHCYVWAVGASSATQAVESPGRFATTPTVSGNVVTLTPRVNASKGVYYGITAYELSDDLSNQVDQLVLPTSVKPFSAVRMGERFAFSVEATYGSGGLLGTMGSYVSMGDNRFVALSREPLAPICGKGDVFIIKAKASYFVVNVVDETYVVLTAYDRSLSYGEYPASLGTTSTFVTFSTVKDAETGYPSVVKVRSFGL
jgi:hypothetical protein